MKFWSGLCVTLVLLLVLYSPLSAAEETKMKAMEGTVTFFYYEDLAAAATFYGEVLQLSLTMDEDWVKIYQITPTSSVGLVKQGRGFHDVAEDKPAMLSMVTEEVDAWNARLKAANVTILKDLPPPATQPGPGSAPVRGFIAEDPGGYTIEFFAWQK